MNIDYHTYVYVLAITFHNHFYLLLYHGGVPYEKKTDSTQKLSPVSAPFSLVCLDTTND